MIRQDGTTDLGGSGRSDYFILDRQHEIYAMLLSAHITDLQVQITVKDCTQELSRIRQAQIAR